MRRSLLYALTIGALLFTGPLAVPSTARQTGDQGSNQTSPDNTGVNRRDRSDQNPTADQQKEDPADRDLAQKIRRSIENDKSLSTYAHNVKVIVQNGGVTLRGPVDTAQEKQIIADKARTLAGKGSVTDEIEVVPEKK